MRSSAASWWVTSALSVIVSGAVFLSTAFAQSSPGNQNGNTSPGSAAPAPQSAPSQSQSQSPAANQAPLSPEPGTGGDQGGMFVFKKQVEEVVLHATVYDQNRNLVTGLSRNDFSVFENGVPQQITAFRPEDVPVALGIVVDNSGSMRDKRDKVEQAVLNLIRASNPQGQIFVVNFGERPYLDQDFTSNEHLLQAALHQVSFKGSTALYDAVVASDMHLKQDSNLPKKVLLVITDGEDNMSVETLADASRKLEQANGPAAIRDWTARRNATIWTRCSAKPGRGNGWGGVFSRLSRSGGEHYANDRARRSYAVSNRIQTHQSKCPAGIQISAGRSTSPRVRQAHRAHAKRLLPFGRQAIKLRLRAQLIGCELTFSANLAFFSGAGFRRLWSHSGCAAAAASGSG